jgi:glycerol-3-phosphate dehydrogenase
MALLTRSVDEHHALALPSRRAKRLFFFTPWRGHTLVGVDERPHEGGPDDLRVTRSEIESFLEEINEALPGAGLALSDVRRVFAGLLPVSDKEAAVLAREDRILEDEDGLTRVLGVKYTTAPSLARRMVDRIAAALPARSAGENFGGEEARRAGEGVRTDLDAAELEEIRREDPRWREVLLETPRVEAAHAVLAIRSRMALTLADVAFRRTGLAMLGLPPERALERAAMVAAELLGWDEARRAREIGSIRERFVMGASGQVRLERCRNPGEVPASSRS